MRGYVSLAWDQHQQRYLRQMKHVSRNTVTWLAQIILDVQDYIYQRWLHRNEKLHQKGEDPNRALLLARIRGLYKQGSTLPEQDQQCFQKTMLQWQTSSGFEMRQWLKVHTQHIKVCLEQAKRREEQGAVDIRKWLTKRGDKKPERHIPDGQSPVQKAPIPRKQRTLSTWLRKRKQTRGPSKQEKRTNQTSETQSRVWYQRTMARFGTRRQVKDKKKSLMPCPLVKLRIQETSAGINKEPPGANTCASPDFTEEECTVQGTSAVPKKEKPIMTGQLLDRIRKKFEKWREKRFSPTDSNIDNSDIEKFLSRKTRNRHMQ